jgi:hypothetical protein
MVLSYERKIWRLKEWLKGFFLETILGLNGDTKGYILL